MNLVADQVIQSVFPKYTAGGCPSKFWMGSTGINELHHSSLAKDTKRLLSVHSFTGCSSHTYKKLLHVMFDQITGTISAVAFFINL